MSSEAHNGLSPGEAIQRELSSRGWNQYDLAQILGLPQSVISALVNSKRVITLDLDRDLSAAFGTAVGYWLKLETEFTLFSAQPADSHSLEEIARRAKLYGTVPVREMQRRGWIGTHSDLAKLEAEIEAFFAPDLCVATRRSEHTAVLTPCQNAWCQRARQIATALSVAIFVPGKLEKLAEELRKLAAYPKEVRHLPKVLANYGIRFVIVEPLAAEKIDGAAFWLSDKSPVIAVSARFDRIDAFWFTVMHEFSHIRHGDALSVDTDLVADSLQTAVIDKDEMESRADKEAADALIERSEMDSFVRRLGPLYSKERIIQFAHRVKIHPGIIVGQLQHRGEIGYSAHREMLSKVRSTITEIALTDGWGRIIPSEIL